MAGGYGWDMVQDGMQCRRGSGGGDAVQGRTKCRKGCSAGGDAAQRGAVLEGVWCRAEHGAGTWCRMGCGAGGDAMKEGRGAGGDVVVVVVVGMQCRRG